MNKYELEPHEKEEKLVDFFFIIFKCC